VLRAVRYRTGSGWGALEALGLVRPFVSFARPPALAVSLGGDAFAIWTGETAANETGEVWANRYVVGKGWEPAREIGPNAGQAPGETPARLPDVAADARGGAVAVWQQWNPVNNGEDIWSNRFEPGGGWDDPERIEERDSGATEAAVAADASGNATAVWIQAGVGTGDRIWSNRLSTSSGWGEAELIDTDEQGITPEVGCAPAGEAIAIWARGSNTRTTIFASRYEP
jgi:hypothetical protein